MDASLRLRNACSGDLQPIQELLEASGLPHEDITTAHLKTFLCAMADMRLVGVAGLETFGSIGMARSLAVDLSYRGRGIATMLLDRLEEMAADQGIDRLFVLTETIEELLRQRGFAKADRHCAPDVIQSTPEFRGLCPESAVLLEKRIESARP